MMRKNTLGSYSFDVTKRILHVLNEHGSSMKKTNLASRAGLNYNVCLRYIQMLDHLGWMELNSEVSITQIGKGVLAQLLDISEAIASSTGNDLWSSNLEEKSIEYPSSSYKSSIQTKPSSLIDEKQIVSQSKQKESNKKKTIMIVDDDKDIAVTYEYFLSSVGYEVRTFIDSHSALREYVSTPLLYDLLILDIRMQDINGLQLY
jgi:CheY-like chemotaxis protein